MEQQKMAENRPARQGDSAADLSAEIAATVEREAGDQVRCTRIGETKYRCNWWSPRTLGPTERGNISGLSCTELRVRKSSLLHVTKKADKLLVSEVPPPVVR